MAKRSPFTSQQERLERRIAILEDEVVAIKGLVDPERSIVKAQFVKVDDPTSPQIIRVSEEGNLETGEASLPWCNAITEEASHTGDTAETTIGTVIIPANKMGPNGFASISVICKSHAAAVFRVYFGQIQAANKIGSWTQAASDYYIGSRSLFVWNKNNTAAQGGEEPDTALQLGTHWVAFGEPQAMTEDTTQDVNIYFTAENANPADTSYLYFVRVEVFYRN